MGSLVDQLDEAVFGAGMLPGSVSATVTRPGKPAIEATGVWRGNILEKVPGSGSFQRSDVQRVISFSRNDVPDLPRGTIVDAPETEGEAIKSWRVDAPLDYQANYHTVIVVPEPA